MAAVYGVFGASEPPEFEADGSTNCESGLVQLRGRALVCATQAVAEACIQCLREEDAKRVEALEDEEEEVVVVEGEDNEEPRWVVVLLPIVCLGGQVWEATVNHEEGGGAFAGVSGSEAAAVHMVETLHENVRDGMRTGKECEVPVENEGHCSGCGMEWTVVCHQLLTGVPPALAP